MVVKDVHWRCGHAVVGEPQWPPIGWTCTLSYLYEQDFTQKIVDVLSYRVPTIARQAWAIRCHIILEFAGVFAHPGKGTKKRNIEEVREISGILLFVVTKFTEMVLTESTNRDW